MTFEQIFDSPGLYVADGFAEGVCFRVDKTNMLHILRYKSVNDLLPEVEIALVYGGLFKKDFRKVLIIKSLFKQDA